MKMESEIHIVKSHALDYVPKDLESNPLAVISSVYG